MQKQPVRKGRPKNRGEVTVTSGIGPGQCGIKRNIPLAVVADGINVVAARTEKAVHHATVILHASAAIGMVWIRVGTTRVVTGERMSRVTHASAVRKRQAGLLAIGIRQPSEKMVETPVFH